MKEKKKIIIMSIVIFMLCISLSALIYLCFFSDKYFKDLGYTNQDIKSIRQYHLEEEITEYNQSLIFALHSEYFSEKNISYYLLFNSQIDYTDCINKIAQKYTVDEVKELLTVLNNDEAAELSEYAKINDINSFIQLKNKGYNVSDSIALDKILNEESMKLFLSLPTIQNPTNFINYINTGYTVDTVINIYNKLGEKTFDDLSNIKYFSDLNDYITDKDFNIKLLSRYLIYSNNNSESAENSIYAVNNNYDFIEDPNFSSFYDNSTETNDHSLTALVNKSNSLNKDYEPEGLQDIEANYRNSAQSLLPEVIEAFIKMSDDCYKATERRILVYSGYRSYYAEESLYNEYLNAAGEGANNKVDSFANRPGHSEHQTGLAFDICQKGYSYNEYDTCISSDWVYENCYNYGFILRYPSSKAFLTGCYYTPYHYRYVGIEAAQIMKNYQWTLEEYNYLFGNNK